MQVFLKCREVDKLQSEIMWRLEGKWNVDGNAIRFHNIVVLFMPMEQSGNCQTLCAIRVETAKSQWPGDFSVQNKLLINPGNALLSPLHIKLKL